MVQSIVKDSSFKHYCSLAMVWVFLNYNILNTWLEMDEIVKKYPSAADDTTHRVTHHILFFVYIVARVYVMTFVWLSITLILLVSVYFIVVKVLALDSNSFDQILKGDTQALLKLTSRQKDGESNTLSVRDLFDCMFSFVSTTNGIIFLGQHCVFTILLCVLFALQMGPVGSMDDKNARKPVLHMFFVMLLVTSNMHFFFNSSAPSTRKEATSKSSFS